MARSTTIWAAALLLAGLSGSGPALTTAEAMPAPLPQETAARPRYYFPRHVKRQIVTNSTAPASSTSSSSPGPSSSSSSSDLELRQSTSDTTPIWASDLSALESQSFPDTGIDGLLSPSTDPPELERPTTERPTGSSAALTTITLGNTIITVTLPKPSTASTGDVRSEPSSPPLEAVSTPDAKSPVDASPSDILSSSAGSSGGIAQPVVQPTPSSSPSSDEPTSSKEASSLQEVDPPSSSPESQPSSPPAEEVESTSQSQNVVGSTGVLPSSVVQPTSSAVDTPVVAPVPSKSEAKNEAGSTGGVPGTIIQPTSTPAQSSELESSASPSASTAEVSPSAPAEPTDARSIGSTGRAPGSTVLPTTTSVDPTSAPTSTADSIISGPFIVPGSTEGLPSSIIQPSESAAAVSSASAEATASQQSPILSGSSGGVPVVVVLPTSSDLSSTDASSSLPTTGIVVGITTAFEPSESMTPTPTAPSVIPTSESISGSETGEPLSSLVSETMSGVVPSTGVTDPTAVPTGQTSPPPGITPTAVPSSLISELSSLASSITSDVESLVSSLVSDITSTLPTGTAPVPIESIISSIESSLSSIPTSDVATDTSTGTSSNVFPPSATASGTDPMPTPSGSTASETLATTGISTSDGPTETSTGIPVSEEPPSSAGSTDLSVSTSAVPLNSTAGPTGSPASSTPIISLPTKSASEGEASSSTPIIPIVPTPRPESKQPVLSVPVTATNSDTQLNVGTSIMQEPTTLPSPTATESGIPSDLPKMVAPPSGLPSAPPNAFLGQVGFKWPLNYPFVTRNDGGNQIFQYLPPAIADALNIPTDQVVMQGLKPFDTTQFQGFITTLALFWIPADLNGTLAAQLRNPADPLWHNKNSTINDLTSLINTAFPLAAGSTPDGGQNAPLSDGGSDSLSGGGVEDGGLDGENIKQSHTVTGTTAGIAAGAVAGAIAYGAAMFFVARRYRNKKLSHKRASSVPTANRHTYGSMPGGAAAFMAGGRRSTAGGRYSHTSGGSGSSQGRSVRTQQISAPVMAENSLGWN